MIKVVFAPEVEEDYTNLLKFLSKRNIWVPMLLRYLM